MALSGRRFGGRASALPHFSDIDLLGYGERVITLDSEIANRALNLRVAKQELNRTKISCFLIDQRCSDSAERVCAIGAAVKADQYQPARQ